MKVRSSGALLLLFAMLAAGPALAAEERCTLAPDPGPCKGLFEKYFFDTETGRCEVFFYGGCDGVVPFETLAECEALCLGPPAPAPGPSGEGQ